VDGSVNRVNLPVDRRASHAKRIDPLAEEVTRFVVLSNCSLSMWTAMVWMASDRMGTTRMQDDPHGCRYCDGTPGRFLRQTSLITLGALERLEANELLATGRRNGVFARSDVGCTAAWRDNFRAGRIHCVDG
jgi:hypothetical protein